jgi:D-lactate dehydrogenase (cytochrome)
LVKSFENVVERYQNYLTDEAAIVKDGHAEKIYFPNNESDVVEVLKEASNSSTPITISGGGTGLSSGRVPRGGWILATDDLKSIEDIRREKWTDPETKIEYGVLLKELDNEYAELNVPASMTIKAIQNYVREMGWFYPPDPTERSAFVGGTVNTNASGARTFKFGPTRDWIKGLKAVLIDGSKLTLNRDINQGTITDSEIFIEREGGQLKIPRPKYEIPKMMKNVAGPIIFDDSHVIDLFIGTGGLFGVTTEVVLKLQRPPKEIVSIFIFCKTSKQAYEIIKTSQKQRKMQKFPTPMAVEYLGKRPISIMHTVDETISLQNEALIILEQDANGEDSMDEAIAFWSELFEELNIEDTRVAQTHSEIENFKKLRHMVPETINSIVKHHGQSKIGTDFAVPEEYLEEYFELAFKIGKQFENYQNERLNLGDRPGYAIWAHAGDTHIHLNLIPRDDEESRKGKDMVLELIEKTVKWGGSIAAEHGLGKKVFGGKPALYHQLGEEGLEDIRKMKYYFDPNNLLNRGNLIPE